MPKYESFDELLRTYLLAQEEKASKERDPDWWWASELGTCMRKQFLRRLGIKPKEKQWRITFIAEQGKAIHSWIQNIVKNTGRLIAAEEELRDENLRYKGKFDLIVNLNEKNKPYLSLVDLKTQRSEAFFRRAKDPATAKVKEFQKMQLASYFLFARRKYPDLKDARIYYLDRGGGVREEFVFKFKPEMFKKVLDELTLLNDYWSKKILPPCNHTWECKEWCDFYKKECEKIEKGELSLDEFVLKFKNKQNK